MISIEPFILDQLSAGVMWQRKREKFYLHGEDDEIIGFATVRRLLESEMIALLSVYIHGTSYEVEMKFSLESYRADKEVM